MTGGIGTSAGAGATGVGVSVVGDTGAAGGAGMVDRGVGAAVGSGVGSLVVLAGGASVVLAGGASVVVVGGVSVVVIAAGDAGEAAVGVPGPPHAARARPVATMAAARAVRVRFMVMSPEVVVACVWSHVTTDHDRLQ